MICHHPTHKHRNMRVAKGNEISQVMSMCVLKRRCSKLVRFRATCQSLKSMFFRIRISLHFSAPVVCNEKSTNKQNKKYMATLTSREGKEGTGGKGDWNGKGGRVEGEGGDRSVPH